MGESGGGWPKAPPAPANILCSLSIPDILSLFSLFQCGLGSYEALLCVSVFPEGKVNSLFFCYKYK